MIQPLGKNVNNMTDRRTLNHRPRRTTFADCLVIVYNVFLISGYTSNSTIYISFGLLLVWMFTVVSSDKGFLPYLLSKKKYRCLSFFLVYITIIGLPLGGLEYTAKQVGATLIIFSPMILLDFYLRNQEKNKLIRMVCYGLAAYLIFAIISLSGYAGGEINARKLAQDSQYYGDIAVGGGYVLAYTGSILSILFLDMKLSGVKIFRLRWLTGWVALIIFGVAIYQIKSTVTFVSWIVGLITCVLFRPVNVDKNRNNIHSVLPIFLALMVLLLFALTSNSIGQWLLRTTANSTDTLMMRLRSIGEYLVSTSEDTTSNYFVGRLSIPLTSLETFVNNPIFGAAYKFGNQFELSKAYGIGRHCEWADALGNYGLVGGIPFLAIYVISIKDTMEMANKRLSIAWIITIFLMGAFNPLRSFSVHFAIFCVIPTIALQLDPRAGDKADINNTSKGQP